MSLCQTISEPITTNTTCDFYNSYSHRINNGQIDDLQLPMVKSARAMERGKKKKKGKKIFSNENKRHNQLTDHYVYMKP